jgi:hypothetical protein
LGSARRQKKAGNSDKEKKLLITFENKKQLHSNRLKSKQI